MKLSNSLKAIASILDTFDHITATKADDEAKEFFVALEASPPMVAWLEKKLAVFNPSGGTDPFIQELRRRADPADSGDPERAELGERLAGLGEFAKYLPMFLEILKILRDNGVFKKAA